MCLGEQLLRKRAKAIQAPIDRIRCDGLATFQPKRLICPLAYQLGRADPPVGSDKF